MSLLHELSPREIELVRLLAGGKSYRQAAAEMGISYKGVDNRAQTIRIKTGSRSIADLTRYAIREGLIQA